MAEMVKQAFDALLNVDINPEHSGTDNGGGQQVSMDDLVFLLADYEQVIVAFIAEENLFKHSRPLRKRRNVDYTSKVEHLRTKDIDTHIPRIPNKQVRRDQGEENCSHRDDQAGSSACARDKEPDSGPGEATCNLSLGDQAEPSYTTVTASVDVGQACFICDKQSDTTFRHPLLQARVCLRCKEHLKLVLFAVDDDNCWMFCCVCGNGGSLYVCDQTGCGRCFCFDCVQKFTSPVICNKVQHSDDWVCFLCEPYTEASHGRLEARADWMHETIRFFQPSSMPLCPDLSYLTGSNKKGLRVLSLCDGIGTGKVVLDDLGFDVEVYYACEINASSRRVASLHDSLIQLGDIRSLGIKELEALGPIDLVLAGPPCNDLSIVNPNRKGFSGTGSLVLRVMEIIQTLQQLWGQRQHIFWLLENTGYMPKVFKQAINDWTGVEPAVWDAKFMTGMCRARNFWGNIPGIYSTPDVRKPLEQERRTLDDALMGRERKARVSHARTITGSSNSLTIKNGVNEPLVMRNGKPAHIWLSEIERLFGFPAHYTDVDLTMTARRKLLGNAWCVPVVKEILHPLVKYYKLKDTSK